MNYTQDEFNNKVLGIVSGHLNVMEVAADLRCQGDPQARRIEEEQMFSNNIIKALEDYDVTSGFFDNDDIEYMFDLASGAILKFP